MILRGCKRVYNFEGNCVGEANGLPHYVNLKDDFLAGKEFGTINGVKYRCLVSKISTNQSKSKDRYQYLYMPVGLRVRDYMDASKNFKFEE